MVIEGGIGEGEIQKVITASERPAKVDMSQTFSSDITWNISNDF